MSKAISLILITIILAVSFSACEKKEEAKPSDTVIVEKAKEVHEVNYRTDEYCGCKYSIPDDWLAAMGDAEVSYKYDNDKNNAVKVSFKQIEVEDDEWESRVKNAVDTTNANKGPVNIVKFSPVDDARYSTYYLEGESQLSGIIYPYEAYLINLDNEGILLVENIGTDINKEASNVKNLIDTLDISGLEDYLGISSEDESSGDNDSEKSNEETLVFP